MIHPPATRAASGAESSPWARGQLLPGGGAGWNSLMPGMAGYRVGWGAGAASLPDGPGQWSDQADPGGRAWSLAQEVCCPGAAAGLR